METIEKNDCPALPLAGTQGLKHGSEIRASEEAIMFINGIDPVELPKCVFEDSLVTMSEGGRDLGRFYVSVEFARRACRPCMLLHAQSQGIIDDSPCGTTVTAYLTADLEVLEEEHHEYVKLSDHILDTRCHMVQHDGEMKINKVTTVGKKVTTDSVSYSMSALRGLVTEGSNFLLMRIIALRKKIPEHMSLISFDQKLQITRTIFRGLEDKQIEIEGETMEVFGMERIVHCVDEDPTTWQCYFLPDGSGPLSDSWHLRRIHPHLSVGHNKLKKGGLLDMKFTLLGLNVKAVLQEALQHLAHVLFVLHMTA
ncbi:ciliogenesis-associated TTC17-interacting protein isoform X2 [Stigmatopora argus]